MAPSQVLSHGVVPALPVLSPNMPASTLALLLYLPPENGKQNSARLFLNAKGGHSAERIPEKVTLTKEFILQREFKASLTKEPRSGMIGLRFFVLMT